MRGIGFSSSGVRSPIYQTVGLMGIGRPDPRTRSNMLSARLMADDNQEYRDRYYKAQDEIRMCMANIKAAYYSISPRWLAIFLGVIPNQENFKKCDQQPFVSIVSGAAAYRFRLPVREYGFGKVYGRNIGGEVVVGCNNASHGNVYYIPASPQLRSCACWRR